MHYNDKFYNINTVHIQGAQSHIEMDQTNIFETRQDRSTNFEPMVIWEVPNEQSIPNTIGNNINMDITIQIT